MVSIARSRSPHNPVLPDFLIVGGMKCGTSSLSFYLRQHPEIFVPFPEPTFFSDEKNWLRGVEWYGRFFRDRRDEPCVGEKTPGYSYDSRRERALEVPKRIHGLLPDVKLIWCLRDPVDRAWSHFWHMARKSGRATTFEEALGRRSCDSPLHSCVYVDRSLYLPQIQRFLEHFPREQMFFVISEDLYENTGATLRSIQAFLGVDPDFTSDHIDEVKASTKLQPGFFRLQGYAYSAIAKLDKRIAKRFQHRLTRIRSFERPPMRPETRRELEEFFAPHNRELADFLGIDVCSRWAQAGSSRSAGTLEA